MFCLSVFFVALKTNVYPPRRLFISSHFSTSFRFTTPIIWYSELFISEYFAYAIPLATNNISSILFFIPLENRIPSSLNRVVFFLYLSKMFCSLSFSNLISIGFRLSSSSNFCHPIMFKKSTTSIFCFLFSLSLKSRCCESYCILFRLFFC